ncbi:ATP-binding protein [Elusimicrobiota bacterium]
MSAEENKERPRQLTQPVEPMSLDWGEEGVTSRGLVACRKMLQSLGQAVKLNSLYAASHPVPISARQETFRLLQHVFAATRWSEFTISLANKRWLLNQTVLAEAARVSATLLDFFEIHRLDSITFVQGVRPFELDALCELASMSSSVIEDISVPDFMKQKGVIRLRLESARYELRRKRGPSGSGSGSGPGSIESPIPKKAAKQGPGQGQGPKVPLPGPSQGFGAFIKGLVEKSVPDQQERAKVYGEVVRMVKDALEQRVSEQTKQLRRDKQHVLNERDRTENVLNTVAEGKVVVDRDGRILMMDHVAEGILGKKLVDVAGKPILENAGGREQIAALARNLVIPPDAAISKEVDVSADEDVLESFRQSMALVQDEEGRVVGTYGILPYVTKFREALKMQEEFVSHVTHELKAPLASICSALELMSDLTSAKLSDQEKRFLDISRRNSGRLRQMINEILDFSKIQSGQMEVHPVPTKIEPMIREAADGLRPWATGKKIRIGISIEPLTKETDSIMADHGRMVQVLTNLISNSIKATPTGGSVHVSACPGEGKYSGYAVLCVKDTGCGISAEDQRRIFERFQQATAKRRYSEGVGLGLNIVRNLVTLHKGSLWVESEPGRGATFSMALPLASAETAVV